MKVILGIHRLKIPIPETSLQYVNVYLIEGTNGYLLVDTGWDNSTAFGSLKRQLDEIGIGFKDISQILVTHIHPDHYGLVGRLKQLSGAEFALHVEEQKMIDARYINMSDLLQRMADWLWVNGVPAREIPKLQKASLPVAKYVAPTHPDIVLHDGETYSTGVFDFQVVWTPGHSQGHICLYEPTRKILLSGDHILPTITPNIGLHPQSGENPLGDFIDSLNKIEQLAIELILPGHENPFTGIKSRVKKLMQHHHQRISNILETMEAKAKTAYQIAKGITWLPDIGGVSLQNLPPLHKRLAILETLSHLEFMRANGEVDKFSADGVIYYRRR